jgi:uncharacterized membrane protein
VADQNVKAPQRTRTGRLRAFDRALWMKASRYTVSGLIFIIAGLVVVIFGILLYTGSLYQAGFLIGGFGVIIVIIGIVRLLIGFINPATPEDLTPLEIREDDTTEEAEPVDDNTIA